MAMCCLAYFVLLTLFLVVPRSLAPWLRSALCAHPLPGPRFEDRRCHFQICPWCDHVATLNSEIDTERREPPRQGIYR